MTPLLPWRPAILSPTGELALDGHVDLDHLDDARGEFIALLQTLDFGAVALVDLVHLWRGTVQSSSTDRPQPLVLDPEAVERVDACRLKPIECVPSPAGMTTSPVVVVLDASAVATPSSKRETICRMADSRIA